jgi:type IV pilus assembly protein PilF
MMIRPLLIAVLLCLLPLLSSCAAVSVASVLASTTASTAVRAIDEEMEENAVEGAQRGDIAEANLQVGIEHLRRGNVEQALARLEKAREADPRNSYVYSVLGLVHQRLGENDKAEQNFRKSLSLDGKNPENLNNYGQFLCRQGKTAEAEKLFLKAAADRLYRTPDVALTNAGLCARRNGNTERARGLLVKALDANPNGAPALLALAEIEYDDGRIANAQKLMQRYVKLAPHTPRSLWLGIRIARQTGDQDVEASLSLLLRNKYPDSAEAAYLREGA